MIRSISNLLHASVGTERLWRWRYRLRTLARGRNRRYSIGLVTYVARFEQYFLPLIRQLVLLFPDTDIHVGINGYHDRERQEAYLREIRRATKGFPNVRLHEFIEPQSLSLLWNRLIRASSTEKTFILNDDVMLSPIARHFIEQSGVLNESVALINATWSHFLISKQTMRKIGWFDERLPGVGNEDEDFEARMALAGMPLPIHNIDGITNFIHPTTDFSYGARTPVVNKKYVAANKVFFDQKWEIFYEPTPGAAFVRIMSAFLRLRPGMETPNFYPLDKSEP